MNRIYKMGEGRRRAIQFMRFALEVSSAAVPGCECWHRPGARLGRGKTRRARNWRRDAAKTRRRGRPRYLNGTRGGRTNPGGIESSSAALTRPRSGYAGYAIDKYLVG
jgi:hypothetical protein